MVPDRAAEVEGYRRLAEAGRVDGVFLTDRRVDDPRPALLDELGLPALLIAASCEDHAPASCVCVDDRPGVRSAVEHLVQLGPTRIAHVAGPEEFVHAASRLDAWAGALADAGLVPGPLVRADFSAQGGADATTSCATASKASSAVPATVVAGGFTIVRR